ncbi:hypothetical protein AVEN_199411-1 [Araneus ventricosus]|uniref:Uncharacterized protein n=1 Tax=Araneus ventricosus TaxID=182803 RepID=A0A4Y2KAT4_ARAVE|nr:hypothetical protein AVEN_199411-1 [Araneus ventricosus]
MRRITCHPRLQHQREERRTKTDGTGHLAAWKGCKAIPVITGSATRQPRKTHAQAAKKDTSEGERKSPQQEENTIEVIAGLTDIKDSLEALRDLKYLIQEFPTIIEAAKK